jgi:predicted ArsR family transcriptional regulator
MAPDLGPAGNDRRTRTDVIRRLLSDGPSTASQLAGALGLSGTAVRRHLDALVAEGAVTSREEAVIGRRGRGRPARLYLLTEIGRARLPHAYDDLAAQALAYLAEQIGEDAVTDFARRRAQHIVDGVRTELDGAATMQERVRVLATALTGSGYAASVDRVGVGAQLCQHHCPVAHVAAKYPQLCEQELAVFTTALGTYAQRLATIARGDSFCTTFIPAAPSDGRDIPVRRPDAAGMHTDVTPEVGARRSEHANKGRTSR